MSAAFDVACEEVKHLKSKPSDADMLEIYGLFKQAKVGNNTTDKPSFLDFKSKAKWEAWTGKKGMDEEAAMEAYVTKTNNMKETYGYAG